MFSNFLDVLSNATQKSEGMFQHGTFDIAGAISDCFYKVLWFLICALMQVIYTVEQTFYWLAGIDKGITLFDKNGDKVGNLDSLFPTIDIETGNVKFGTLFGDNKLFEITKIMLAVGCAMVVIFLVFAIILNFFFISFLFLNHKL